MSDITYALEMRNIVKRFHALMAVNNVSIRIQPGEVHAICGENGAGKSTLMRILSGEYPDYEGQILIRGKEVRLETPAQAKCHGIEIIHQELGLARPISVAENIMAGRLPRSKWIFLDNKKMTDYAHKYLAMVGLEHVNPHAIVSTLSQHEAQLVEIAKALSNEPSILIMDEPTSALSRNEVTRLFKIIDKLKSEGLAILYISHFLNEVFRVADNITTMRDGGHIASCTTCSTTQEEVVRQMVGTDVKDFYAARVTNIGKPVLEAERLTRLGFFRDVTFSVHEGEVLGICGLAGSGRSELARALVGLDIWDEGTLKYMGETIKNRSYDSAIRRNIAYLPEDRKIQGLALDQAIGFNISSAKTVSQNKSFWADMSDKDGSIEKLLDRLKVVPRDTGKVVGQLSGGNQQKVLLAKWMHIGPKLLILDEPTRGVDVGAKEAIHEAIKEYVNQGCAVILISSDLMELMGLSDRILILNHGRVNLVMDKDECTEETLLLAANGGCCDE